MDIRLITKTTESINFITKRRGRGRGSRVLLLTREAGRLSRGRVLSTGIASDRWRWVSNVINFISRERSTIRTRYGRGVDRFKFGMKDAISKVRISRDKRYGFSIEQSSM